MCKVSIIMAAYNSEAYISESLTSILNQTFKDWECLIFDDNSLDKTVDIIKDFMNKDKRFKLIKSDKNVGAAQARNHCIKQARGVYIAILDSDDLCCDNRLLEQYNFLKSHPEYSLVGSLSKSFDGNKEWVSIKKVGEINARDLKKGMPLVHSTLMIKKDVLINIGGYPNYRRIQDYAMIMNVFSKGNKGYILNSILIKYRCDDDNYKRRTFKSRINEVLIRYRGYKQLKYPCYYYIYTLKPLISVLVPRLLIKMYHKHKEN